MRARLLMTLLFALGGCAGDLRSAPVRVPVAAGAWVRFDTAGIIGASAWGVADRAASRRMTIDDPVRVASVSKQIVAIGVMRLVEVGKLDLDADVSPLLGFALRNPAFPDQPITLHLLLSHRSSVRDGIDYVLPLDTTLRQALADSAAWDLAHPPGSYFRYTNLNFPLIAAAMEAATGERFDRLIQRLVLTPLHLDACFNWSGCSDAAIRRAVVLYAADGSVRRDDLRGAPPHCLPVPARDGSCDLTRWRPGVNGASFSPQGGLRISMRDLATIGRLLLGNGAVDGVRLLSPASIATLREITWTADGANGETDGGFYCGYSLGTQITLPPRGACGGDPFGDGRPRLGHAGDAYGVKAGLWIDPARESGVAYVTTAIADDAPRGRSGYTLAEEAIARQSIGAR